MALMAFPRRMLQFPSEAGTSSAATTPITFAGTTSMCNWTACKPTRIIRWGALITTAAGDDASANLQFLMNTYTLPQKGGTKTTGSTTSTSGTGYNSSNAPVFYVDTAGGSLTVPNAQLVLNSNVGLAIGAVVWHNVNPQVAQTGGYYPAPDTALIPPGGVSTQLVIYPGQSFEIYCETVGSTAGHGIFLVEIEEQPWVADYNNNAMVLSGYPANGTNPTPSYPWQTNSAGTLGGFNYQS